MMTTIPCPAAEIPLLTDLFWVMFQIRRVFTFLSGMIIKLDVIPECDANKLNLTKVPGLWLFALGLRCARIQMTELSFQQVLNEDIFKDVQRLVNVVDGVVNDEDSSLQAVLGCWRNFIDSCQQVWLSATRHWFGFPLLPTNKTRCMDAFRSSCQQHSACATSGCGVV